MSKTRPSSPITTVLQCRACGASRGRVSSDRARAARLVCASRFSFRAAISVFPDADPFRCSERARRAWFAAPGVDPDAICSTSATPAINPDAICYTSATSAPNPDAICGTLAGRMQKGTYFSTVRTENQPNRPRALEKLTGRQPGTKN